MSDPNGTAVPAITLDPAAPGASTAPTAAPKPADSGEPSWLAERLSRENRSLLKKAGFDTLEDAQAAAAALKAQKEAEKTAADKAAEALQRAAAAESNSKALSDVVAEYAARQMVGLTPEQKAAVVAVAGEDPAKQLKAISALQPTWAAPAATPSGRTAY